MPRRKAGLSPGTGLARRTALRTRANLARMSQRTVDQLPARQAVIRQVWARDRHCVARDLVPTVPCTGELEVDEICPRSACPGGHLDPDNCQLLCRGHHRWKHLNPRLAAALGLRRWSWQT
jgi:5-methylcytosine-specific restriction endonuclease McrA